MPVQAISVRIPSYFLTVVLAAVPLAAQAPFSINTIFPPLGGASGSDLTSPNGLVSDGAGGLYISDYAQNRVIRRTSTGVVTVIAGTGVAGFSGDSGPAVSAQLNQPSGLARDTGGNVYIADEGNNRIRRITAGGTITTVAGNGFGSTGYGDGNVASQVSIGTPHTVSVDAAGNFYFPVFGRGTVAKVDTNGVITTFVSAGPGGSQISPIATAMDPNGNLLIGTVTGIYRREANGAITTVSSFTLSGSFTVSADAVRGVCYHTINEVRCSGQTVASATFIAAIAFDGGNLLIADPSAARILQLTPAGGLSTLFKGTAKPSVKTPKHVAYGPDGSVYIADEAGHAVWRLDPNGAASVLAGTGVGGFGSDGGPANESALLAPSGIATDSAGNVYFTEIGAHRVRLVTTDGIIHTVAGNSPGVAAFAGDGGPAILAAFNTPMDLALDAAGNIYIADTYNNRIRRIAKATGIITSVAGSGPMSGFDSGASAGDGAEAVAALLNNPAAVAVGPTGHIYVGESRRVRRFLPGGNITAFAGNGTCGDAGDGGPALNASLCDVYGVTVDSSNNSYVTTLNRIRRIDPNGLIANVAGNGVAGFSGDGGPALAAQIWAWGVAVDAAGGLSFADPSTGRVRKVIGGNRCGLTLSDFARALSAAPGSGILVVNPGFGCSFSATSDAPWLHIDGGVSGSGNKSLQYSFDTNLTSNARGATIQVVVNGASATFFLYQSASSCQYAPSPLSTPGPLAFSGFVSLNQTPALCAAYTVSSDSPWLSTLSPPAYAATPSASYAVPNNSSPLSRTGTLNISGHIFTVTQAASPVQISSPLPGSALTGSTLFQWTTQSADLFHYEASTVPGAANIASGNTANGSATVAIPGGGGPVYFRLWYRTSGVWQPVPVDVSYGAIAPNPPGPVTLLTPSSAATGLDTNASLTWAAASGATSYDIMFGTSSPPPVFASTSGTLYTPSLVRGTPYYWQIVARNGSGTNSSPIWSFTTASLPPPTPVGVSPSSGSGLSQTMTFTFRDPRGWQDLGVVNVLVNSALDGRVGCFLAYARTINVLYLVNDAGDGLLPGLVLNGTGSVGNSQCTINGATTSASGTGTDLTLTLGITFQSSFAGNKIVFQAARDVVETNSGWQALGVWQIPGAVSSISISVATAVPARGAGRTQTMEINVTASNGWQDLGVVNVLVNDALDGRQGCFLAYARSINVLYLVNDPGDALLPGLVMNGSGSVSNSQCTINGVSSSAVGSGNNLRLILNITYNQAFNGNRVVFAAARDGNQLNNTGWLSVGSWTVQ